MPQESFPNLIVIGAAKCGTSSLHYYLDLHPAISMARDKELNYFVEADNWQRGIAWYRSNFDASATVRGESSPRYTSYPHNRGIPARIHSILPHVKLIYMVRDPLERLISHYFYHYTTHVENRDLETALLDLDECNYVQQSRYYQQISRFLTFFDQEQIRIVALETLARDPKRTMAGLFDFLEVDTGFYSPEFMRILNPSHIKRRKTRAGLVCKRIFEATITPMLPFHLRTAIGSRLSVPFSKPVQRPELSRDQRRRLCVYLKKDIHRFRKLTGEALSTWSV